MIEAAAFAIMTSLCLTALAGAAGYLALLERKWLKGFYALACAGAAALVLWFYWPAVASVL